MALSDTKKVQDIINVCGVEAQKVRDSIATIKTMRTKFMAVNPDVAGTPLEGNLTAVSNAIDALDAEASKAVWTGMIAAVVPTHRNITLDEG